MTHFATIDVEVGDRVQRGALLGTICDSKVSGKPNTSHIHQGLKKTKKPLPKQPERVFRVVGPKGGNIARRKTAAQVGKGMGGWVKRFGSITVRPDERA